MAFRQAKQNKTQTQIKAVTNCHDTLSIWQKFQAAIKFGVNSYTLGFDIVIAIWI